ncbi:hypothetical protein HanRHA438_Chr10g0433111 [Helianthus annuus]|uniref:Uncharacterized protein n=1 Tax=Helianthus annuus TaxID=4232 RepID=A0A251TI63_HELAN|nr:hypothetical protein HanXRQr2_Chr10g0420701 [Helianthus annuus]KAJ0512421.1 hypothetical protein HanHA300_Chr10g0346081 [Helianthus annuus]KAJ0528537.1 hypothetical protein HanHA89_Chr10g0367521 [Helianthus annuus]KAJ0698918.1 hypothetical protein HanOQP8_Chr10g0350061 [Helianthus annuus]KAJ0877848.1 hypothetical protein HanRHA438_Chr10g0433111 [Helianthus annuus]
MYEDIGSGSYCVSILSLEMYLCYFETFLSLCYFDTFIICIFGLFYICFNLVLFFVYFISIVR